MGKKRVIHKLHKEAPTFIFDPKTEGQALALKLYKKSDLLFLLGPAGSGKSHVALACALSDSTFIPTNKRCGRGFADKIVLVRPLVEAGEKLGALPGGINEKTEPFMRPLFDCIGKLIKSGNESSRAFNHYFEISPLAYIRGRTLENCVAILDEAQNCTSKQLKMFITRLGINAKMIITGDLSQKDIIDSGLHRYVYRLKNVPRVGVIEFTDEDVVRHPLVKEVIRLFPED